MKKFSLKIDDVHSLNKENGIPVEKIGDLLKTLYAAIDNGTGSKVTLGQIRGNCYALDFYTKDAGLYENFITVHKNIEQVGVDDLTFEQRKYAATLKLILGGTFYLTAYDEKDEPIAKINVIGQRQLTNFYYSTDVVYGILSELGSSTLANSKKHIYLDGINYKIFISGAQDLDLKPFYGTHKIRAEIRQKRSSIDGHIINSELISFITVTKGNLIDNLNNSGEVDLEALKGIHTLEDVLSSIYANR